MDANQARTDSGRQMSGAGVVRNNSVSFAQDCAVLAKLEPIEVRRSGKQSSRESFLARTGADDDTKPFCKETARERCESGPHFARDPVASARKWAEDNELLRCKPCIHHHLRSTR